MLGRDISYTLQNYGTHNRLKSTDLHHEFFTFIQGNNQAKLHEVHNEPIQHREIAVCFKIPMDCIKTI